MELDILDRIMLLSILPEKGDILTLRIVKELTDSIGFTEAEHSEFELKQGEGRILWNKSKEVSKDIPIGPRGMIIIAEKIKELSDKKELTMNYISLYDRFVDKITESMV